MTRDKSAALRVVADATLFVLPSGVDLKVYRNIDCSALAAEVSVTYCRVEQPRDWDSCKVASRFSIIHISNDLFLYAMTVQL